MAHNIGNMLKRREQDHTRENLGVSQDMVEGTTTELEKLPNLKDRTR